jgi:carbamoylphosphate synthase large subunit
MCSKIAEALDVHGSINVQSKLSAHGPMIFDINPRFSSTVLLRHQIGFHDVVWSIEEEMNQKPDVETWALPVSSEFVLLSSFARLANRDYKK